MELNKREKGVLDRCKSRTVRSNRIWLITNLLLCFCLYILNLAGKLGSVALNVFAIAATGYSVYVYDSENLIKKLAVRIDELERKK